MFFTKLKIVTQSPKCLSEQQIIMRIKSISMYDLGASMRKEAKNQEQNCEKSIQNSQQSQQESPNKNEVNFDECAHINISNQLSPNEIIAPFKRKSPKLHSRRIPKSNFTHLTQLFSTKSQLKHYYQSKAKFPYKKPSSSSTANDPADSSQCLICVNSPPDSVFMPCGHGGICYDCSLDLWKRTGECYLCRSQINSVLQIDLENTFGEYLKIISETYLEANGQQEEEEEDEEEEIIEDEILNSTEIQEIQRICNRETQRIENQQQQS